MDYNKILQSKTIQDIYNKNPNRSSIATTASATSTGQSLEINIYREDGRLRHHSDTRASTTDSFDLNNPDSPGYKSSLQFKHQADNKEEEDPNLLSPSPFLPDDDWASACDGSIHDSDDEEGTFHSAISVQCLHQLDDEEDLISSDSSEECRRYMANLVDRLYNERETISPDEKATFLFWCKGGSGRGWFAYYVDSKVYN
ncbi:uncharacterized protein TRIADDRAFT_55779 [Trichoplax adhaerens]|uniref:Uncharacterized protein n=1 Tax=Trichoplax adhaerens TaxID=10228 RepID=B3RVU5_TRIAD|nr:predicted protein [Trichoplax adhaerens]EDV25559.1 predicted protein [Trichoplax adhaerens]|eukprot:XP_002111592.1 predicted protein [Trichoplax adhaerens]